MEGPLSDIPAWRRFLYFGFLISVLALCIFFISAELYENEIASRRLTVGAGAFGAVAAYLLWSDFLKGLWYRE